MRLRQTVIALVAAVAVGVAATPACADTVTATFSNVNPGQTTNITSPLLSGTEDGWAGVYNFTNASGARTGNFSGFCIDIAQDISYNQTVTFSVASLANAPTPGTSMGQLKANLIGELWYQDFASIKTNQDAAAFQIAIWEIINETGNTLDVQSGSFKAAADGLSTSVTTATLTQANTWLGNLNLDGTGPKADLIALTSSTAQDYVVQAVPVPPGLVLGGVGVFCLLLPSLWRSRKRQLAPAFPAR